MISSQYFNIIYDPAGCKAAVRRGLAGFDDTVFCTLRTAVRQPASACCTQGSRLAADFSEETTEKRNEEFQLHVIWVIRKNLSIHCDSCIKRFSSNKSKGEEDEVHIMKMRQSNEKETDFFCPQYLRKAEVSEQPT